MQLSTSQFLDIAGIQITGARIVGFLNLEAAIVKVPISFTGCRLGTVSISRASLHEFTLYLCWCRSLTAKVVTIDSTLNLRGSNFEDLVDSATLELFASWRIEDATKNPEDVQAAEKNSPNSKRR